MAGRVTCPTLVGRTHELASLCQALDTTAAGSGRVVLVEGEAGVGKSRLLREFSVLARDRGATVLSGACFPFTESIPFAPLVGPLGQLEVDPSGVARRASNETDRGQYFQLVADALSGVARDGPLVLAVEDLHWADAGTGDLFLFLAHDVSRRGVLLVATRRTDEHYRASNSPMH